MTDRPQALAPIAAAGALANTAETIEEIEKWTALEWQLREKLRPSNLENRAINRETARLQQVYQQDAEAREKAASEINSTF